MAVCQATRVQRRRKSSLIATTPAVIGQISNSNRKKQREKSVNSARIEAGGRALVMTDIKSIVARHDCDMPKKHKLSCKPASLAILISSFEGGQYQPGNT